MCAVNVEIHVFLLEKDWWKFPADNAVKHRFPSVESVLIASFVDAVSHQGRSSFVNYVFSLCLLKFLLQCFLCVGYAALMYNTTCLTIPHSITALFDEVVCLVELKY